MTLLRPSLGTSADIAVRHRIKPERRGCVSSARSTGVVLGPLVKKSYLAMGTCLSHLSHFNEMQWVWFAPAFAANENKVRGKS